MLSTDIPSRKRYTSESRETRVSPTRYTPSIILTYSLCMKWPANPSSHAEGLWDNWMAVRIVGYFEFDLLACGCFGSSPRPSSLKSFLAFSAGAVRLHGAITYPNFGDP